VRNWQDEAAVKIEAAAERWILLGLATFAMAWAIVRARVQAITIDEAVTYVNFVLPEAPTYWTPHANNHILNSVLIRMCTGVFGTSNLTVRSGALIGAAIFILASYFLTALVNQGFLLRISLFVCLVFNPFIFDFLVAARGYGLASGFLLSAICLVAYAKKPPYPASFRSLTITCGWAAVCIVLSFMSNFSFAFVDAASIVLLYLWASGGYPLKSAKGSGLAAACFLPCLLAAAALAPLLLQWQEPLIYGAHHLSETFKSLQQASFYELNPSVSEMLFIDVPGVILPVLAIFAAWRVALMAAHWSSLRSAQSRWSLAFAAIPAVSVACAVFMHWLVFRYHRTPLPTDRTGIYIVFLITLSVGLLAAVPIPTPGGEISRRVLTILMAILGSYFLLCLRVSYFKEWKWDSDTDKIYSVLAYYNRTCGLKDIPVNWRYDSSLNFYRAASGRESLQEFSSSLTLTPSQKYPVGKRAYVVYQPEDRDFLKDHALRVLYQAPSGAAIAFDPEVRPPPGETTCPLTLPDAGQ
jgi:hypothetical protein